MPRLQAIEDETLEKAGLLCFYPRISRGEKKKKRHRCIPCDFRARRVPTLLQKT